MQESQVPCTAPGPWVTLAMFAEVRDQGTPQARCREGVVGSVPCVQSKTGEDQGVAPRQGWLHGGNRAPWTRGPQDPQEKEQNMVMETWLSGEECRKDKKMLCDSHIHSWSEELRSQAQPLC